MASRKLWIGLGVLVLLGAGYFVYRAHAASGVGGKVLTYTVQPGNVTQVVSAPAQIGPPTQIPLSFRAAGQITYLPVQLGTKVTAGEVLARLDTTDQAKQVQESAASLAAAKARLAQAEEPPTSATVQQAQANLAAAKAKLAQAEEGPTAQQLAAAQAQVTADRQGVQAAQTALANAQTNEQEANTQLALAQLAYPSTAPQAINAQTSYDQAATALANAQQGVQGAQAQLAQAQSNLATLESQPDPNAVAAAQAAVAQAQAAYDAVLTPPDPQVIAAAQAAVAQAQAAYSLDQANMADYVITSPISGVVTLVNDAVGQFTGAGQPVVEVADTNPNDLEVVAQVAETDIPQLKVGEQAVFVPDANTKQSFSGKVLAVAPTATTQANVTYYDATVSLDSPGSKLVSGMTGTETITTATAQNTLYVPDTAVHLKNGHTEVYLTEQVNGKTVYKHQRIKTGLYNENDIQVLRGLKAGDVIIASGGIPGGKAAAATGFKFGPLGGRGKGGARGLKK